MEDGKLEFDKAIAAAQMADGKIVGVGELVGILMQKKMEAPDTAVTLSTSKLTPSLSRIRPGWRTRRKTG